MEVMIWSDVMIKIDFNYIKNKLNEINSDINIYNITSDKVVFEDRVLLKCFYCEKYNTNWMCPPRISNLNYQNIIKEYKNIAVLSITSDFDVINFSEVRYKSTNTLHKTLLMLEKEIWNNNNSLVVSFIGGSCKLCKNGCAQDKCRNQKHARIPIEATGINVVKTLGNIGVDIVFPVKNSLTRYGMLLW
jgi:predicted metal-binding protein